MPKTPAVAFTAGGVAAVKFKEKNMGPLCFQQESLFAYMGQSGHNHERVNCDSLCSVMSFLEADSA